MLSAFIAFRKFRGSPAKVWKGNIKITKFLSLEFSVFSHKMQEEMRATPRQHSAPVASRATSCHPIFSQYRSRCSRGAEAHVLCWAVAMRLNSQLQSNGVLKMSNKIIECCLSFAAQKAAVHCYLHHSTLCRKCCHLLIGEVALVIAQCAAR